MKPESIRLSSTSDIAASRSINIEILRILAMLLIVLCHFYNHGLFSKPSNYSEVSVSLSFDKSLLAYINYFLAQYVLEISSIAVNCYILITGFFMVKKSFRLSRIVKLWFMVAFYSILIPLFLLLFFNVDIGGYKTIIKSFLPVTFKEYWFITNYIGLMLLSPLLNSYLSKLDKKSFKKHLIVLAFINLTVVPFFPMGDTYGGSYSLLWFVFLYIVSAYISIFNVSISHPGRKFWILSFILFVYALAIEFIFAYFFHTGLRNSSSFSYNGLIFLMSLYCFLWFKDKEIQGKFFYFISKLAPYTLGVYLISDHKLIRHIIWGAIDWSDYLSKAYALPYAIAICVLIFLTCIIIDIARNQLFLLCKIDSLTKGITSPMEKYISQLI